MFKLPLVFLSIAVAVIPTMVSASYINYTKDLDTNIITDGSGLEWLAFTETNVMSVEQALSAYSDDGWFVASAQEVDQLYDDFFGEFDWVGVRDNHISQYENSALTAVTDESVARFHELFGKTSADDACSDYPGSLYTCEIEGHRYTLNRTDFFFSSLEFNIADEPRLWTFYSAMVGSKYGQRYTFAENGRIIPASVYTRSKDPSRFKGRKDGYAIALTRSVPDGTTNNQNKSTEVSAPATLSLFILAFIAMNVRRKS
ncbi:hypothetical protein [Alteromonas sp. OM2203]|uniref:hypothetical protein n=1 Tax=Alteromonas sp. OM2203 TaxID=3398817 RepID=UPI003AF39530